jgi:hypothetical protein
MTHKRLTHSLSLVNAIALEAVELPPAERQAFIQKRVAELLAEDRPWRPSQSAGVRLGFEEMLEAWIEDAVEVIESTKVLQDDDAT